MKADCAIITALSSELDKVLYHFRHAEQVIDDRQGGRRYFESISPTGLKLVGATSLGMGQLNAAVLAKDLIEKYSPNSLILTGITGGLEKKVPLGDVVISNQIIDYELGKVTPNGYNPHWSTYSIDSNILQCAINYRDNTWTEYIHTKRPKQGRNGNPNFHIGLYLCGNKVIADKETAGALKYFWGKALAIEMESAGVASVLRQMTNPPHFIVIKGICDYADSLKNDDWQAYAADAAASFTYSFVSKQLRPSDIQAPHRQQVKNEINFKGIRVALGEAYNLAELEGLCLDLGIDWEEIAGERKSQKIMDLILYVKRRGLLEKLIQAVNNDRGQLLDFYIDK